MQNSVRCRVYYQGRKGSHSIKRRWFIKTRDIFTAGKCYTSVRFTLCHTRLGNLNHFGVGLLKMNLANGVYCDGCIKGKQARKPFAYKKDKGVLVSTMDIASWGGKKYIFILIYDNNRHLFCNF